MLKFLDVGKWTKIEKTIDQKPNVLLSLFSILGSITALIQVFNDLYYGIFVGVAIEILIVMVLIAVFILNERRHHKDAKILFLSFINIILFIFASIVPKNIGVYFLFFPIIGITSLVFHQHENKLRNIFIFLPIILLVILELSDYQFFGSINIQEGVIDNSSYIINLFVSLAVLVLSIVYMTKINQEIDNNRIKISDELRLINLDLKKANTELDHFVYSTSHDLKAPLSSIQGIINVAKKDDASGMDHQYYNMIEERIDKLNQFIKEIIDLSRNSRLDVKSDEIDIKELIHSVIENYRYMDEAGRIRFEENIMIDRLIKSDKARLEVVMNNLIANAIKYHRPDQEDQFIKVTAEKIHSTLYIIIKDNGQGIDPDRVEHIFEMFYRGHEDSQGSGLGLYIVKEVIDKMNGNIDVKSEPNVGTEITLSVLL